MINVSILGATGYTGVELVKILVRHKGVRLQRLTSESAPGKRFSELYPALLGVCDIVLSENDVEGVAEVSDVVFMCLPHGASMDAAAVVASKGKLAIDLSADYRISDAALYESAYKIAHRHTELLNRAVYGLAEIFTDDIKRADMIAVPGCYPTSILIPILPLIKSGIIDGNLIFADSKSGVSGAGKKATETTHFCEANEDFKPYGIFSHRHKPEIDHIIERYTGAKTDIVFTPHLAPITRGMLSTIYSVGKVEQAAIVDTWKEFYADRKMVRVRT
ncbi:MAG: N-acetyl-gamma-glutamyl-phosphate reductase, partial [Deferribacteraceae bacterium]|nr:N-acetyl-gamma-glutamyl-phosphate reductase [Deferribacteraceae bacterium]